VGCAVVITANTSVSVNGVPGARIQHVRGFGQHDPTSPMFFVAGMEVLTRVIAKEVEDQLLEFPLYNAYPFMLMMLSCSSNQMCRSCEQSRRYLICS
jgi:hypothetical protein